MPYTVLWTREAENDLAALHLRVRQFGLTLWRPAAEIDSVLRYAPEDFGVPMEDFPGLWAFAAPTAVGNERLAVVFCIVPADMQVIVLKPYLLATHD